MISLFHQKIQPSWIRLPIIVGLVIALSFTGFRIHSLTHAAISSSFVIRSGSNLLLNGQKFRFAGANIHWLGIDDAVGGTYPTTSRIDNVFAAAHAMNATVIRSITLGASAGCAECIEPNLNQFNDQAFGTIDYAIREAASYNMHLIIPLVDNWHYYDGGKHTFTDWRSLAYEDHFYTNPTVIQDFKNYIAHVLNHVNSYTGVALKDDPTIMAWETGNELNTAPDSWTEMIAEYIKSIAPYQLVADGKAAYFSAGSSSSQLQLPAVDLYTSHSYPLSIASIQASANMVKQYNKVYYIGEYDWTGQHGGDPLMNVLQFIEQPTDNIAGDLFWDLYDSGYSNNGQYVLHYPGDTQVMQQRVQMLTTHAWIMNNSVTHTLPTTRKTVERGDGIRTPTTALQAHSYQ